jgi:hypothetical protein
MTAQTTIGSFACFVIACDKREAFVQGSEATKQSRLPCGTLDCFASLAMTNFNVGVLGVERDL